MALMLAICNPQPNWMPRKPKLMFQICQKVRGGLSMLVDTFPEKPDHWSAQKVRTITATKRRASLTIIQSRQGTQTRTHFPGQRARTISPFPVMADAARKVHARLGAKAQDIL